MTKSEIIKAAKELANALCYVSPICNGLHDPVRRQEWNGVIHALIALVPKDGEVVAPEEPTKEMIIAGEMAVENHKDSTWDSGGDGKQHNSYEYFTVGVERSVYKAMLKAAKEGK